MTLQSANMARSHLVVDTGFTKTSHLSFITLARVTLVVNRTLGNCRSDQLLAEMSSEVNE